MGNEAASIWNGSRQQRNKSRLICNSCLISILFALISQQKSDPQSRNHGHKLTPQIIFSFFRWQLQQRCQIWFSYLLHENCVGCYNNSLSTRNRFSRCIIFETTAFHCYRSHSFLFQNSAIVFILLHCSRRDRNGCLRYVASFITENFTSFDFILRSKQGIWWPPTRYKQRNYN